MYGEFSLIFRFVLTMLLQAHVKRKYIGIFLSIM